MRKIVLVAVAVAATLNAASAAHRACFSKADIQAREAILFQTNLMVASSSCHDLTYARFRLRNRLQIIRYQHQMIAHFRRAGARRPAQSFESWITALANEDAGKVAGLRENEVCQQSAKLFQLASSLDANGLRAYAATQALKNPFDDPPCRR
jgi:hypothetical protein